MRIGTDCCLWHGAVGFVTLWLATAAFPPEVVLALRPIPAGAEMVLLYGYFKLADNDLKKKTRF